MLVGQDGMCGGIPDHEMDRATGAANPEPGLIGGVGGYRDVLIKMGETGLPGEDVLHGPGSAMDAIGLPDRIARQSMRPTFDPIVV